MTGNALGACITLSERTPSQYTFCFKNVQGGATRPPLSMFTPAKEMTITSIFKVILNVSCAPIRQGLHNYFLMTESNSGRA